MVEGAGRIRIAVSACVVGEAVRYDGYHRASRYVTGALSEAFELVPECPEVGIGLGVPRPKIHLEPGDSGERLIGSDGRDLTAVMECYAEATAHRFRRAGVAGAVLKSRSPSCGLGDARVWDGHRNVGRSTGVFARTLRREAPGIPLIRASDLGAPALRDDWLTRVFAGAELSRLEEASTLRMDALFRFQGRWKMALMAHSEASARRLGRQLAAATSAGDVLGEYGEGFRAGFAGPTSRGTHANVLERLAGHLKARIGLRARQRIQETIRAFREGRAALAAPTRAIAREARRLGVRSLLDQAALESRASVLRYREDVYDGDPAIGTDDRSRGSAANRR